MRSIVSINMLIPNVEEHLQYLSGESLRDYDIAIFNPQFPYLDRIFFDGGGSCLSIESTRILIAAMLHWKNEFKNALQAGKTIFIVMNEHKSDHGATSSTMKLKNQRMYSTTSLNNYQSLPFDISLTNSKGRKIIPVSSSYKSIYEAIKEIISYKVIIDSKLTTKTFTTKDGAPVGGVVKLSDIPGHIVLLPYFDFDGSDFSEQEDDQEVWTDLALRTSGAFLSQVFAIDKVIRSSQEHSPPPAWIEDIESPKVISTIDKDITSIDSQILTLQSERAVLVQSKSEATEYSYLLYETGKVLERSIEKSLRLLGYTAETLQTDDLEIDHVIVGPSGKRMIGESEGKDTSAIDIAKFRQLESNIGEDLQRDEVSEPAKGILFGNGYRLTVPNERPEQFTQKCITNAKRLSSSLVRTTDLYTVALYVLDHLNDEDFKGACREAIENTVGIVTFPIIPNTPASA